MLLVGLLIELLRGGARLGGGWWSFRDDSRLDAVFEVFQIVRISGGFLSRGGGYLLRSFNWRLLLLLGWLRLRLGLRLRSRLGDRSQLRWLGAGRGGEYSSLSLCFCSVVRGGYKLRGTISQGDDLLSRAGKDDVGTGRGYILRLGKYLLLGWLLNHGRRLPNNRGLNNFGKLRSLRTNLDLTGGNGGHRNGGSSAWTGRGFRHPRAIVANSSQVCWVLRDLLLSRDGDRGLWRNLRILRFCYD